MFDNEELNIPDHLFTENFEDDLHAPEAGVYLPAVSPGPVEFVFNLDKVNTIVVQGETMPQIEWTAEILTDKLPAERLLSPTNGRVRVPFQRSSFYVFPKRGISPAGELYRALGLHETHGKANNKGEVIERLQQASGSAVGRGISGLEAYNRNTGERFSTNPNVKKGDKPWPRTENGGYALDVQFSDGTRKPGREQIVSLQVGH